MSRSILKKLLFIIVIFSIVAASYGESIYTDKWSVFSVEGKIELGGSAKISGYAGSNADGLLSGGEYPIVIGDNAEMNNISIATTDSSIVSYQSQKVSPTINTIDEKINFGVEDSWFDVKVPKYDTLPKKNDIVTGNWGSGAEIEYSGRYNKIDIETQLTINLKNEDILIAVDEMSVTGAGKVVVNRTGKGNLHIVVLNSLNLAGDGQINKKNSSSEEYVNLYYLSSSNPLNILGNTKVDGSLYIENESLTISGSGTVTGKVITDGDSVILSGAGVSGTGAAGDLYASEATITLSGGAKLSGGIVSGGDSVELSGGISEIEYIYAPEADVVLKESASVSGFVIGSTLNMSGASNVSNGDVGNEVPDWTDLDDNEVELADISVLEVTDTGVSDFENSNIFKSLTTISMKQFVSQRKEIEGLYDVVYIGTGRYSDETATIGTNKTERIIAHATKNILNDITDLKAEEIEDSFIEKNYLVIFSSDIYNGTKLSTHFSKYKDGDLKNTKVIDDMDEMLVVMGRHTNLRPTLNLSDYTDNKVYRVGESFRLNYTTNIVGVRTKLYIDRNFNNVIDLNEQVASGGSESIEFVIPRAFSGIRAWTLVAEDSNGRRVIKSGYITIIGTKVEVNVLQVMNNQDKGSLLVENNMKQDYLDGDTVQQELGLDIDVYDINVDVVDINQFNIADESADNYVDLSNYNMVLFGFADSYGNSYGTLSTAGKTKLDKFINTGQSVMFTHDMIFVNSPSWESYRSIFAQTGTEHNMGYGAPSKTTNTQKINEGILTMYPFKLSDNITVNTTHNQYFGLSMEDSEVIPWYNLKSSEADTYKRDPYDSYNHYYTYSIGNLTYSGTGHTPSGFPDSEQRLFLNTMFRAFIGANHPPIVTISNPTEDDIVLGDDNIDIEFEAIDMDWADGTISIDIYIGSNLVEEMDIQNNGEKVTFSTNEYTKGEENIIKVVATDERGASASDKVSLYIPDDSLTVNFLNPATDYLQTNDGVIVEFEVESRYKVRTITTNDDGTKNYSSSLDPLATPKFTLTIDSTSSYDTNEDSTELVLTEEAITADRIAADEVDDVLVRKFKMKIQDDTDPTSIYQKIINGESIKLRVDASTSDELVNGSVEKTVSITEPVVTGVTITNLTSKGLFESLLDKNGINLYDSTSTDNSFYTQTLSQSEIGFVIDSEVYMKPGDQVEVAITYTDNYLSADSDEILDYLSLNNGLSAQEVAISTDGSNAVTATYTLTFVDKDTFTSGLTEVELGLNISDANNGRAKLRKIDLNASTTPPTASIDLLKNDNPATSTEGAPVYIGKSDSYGYRFTTGSDKIAAYLVAFDYDWEKSDLKSESDISTMNNILDNKYYFATSQNMVYPLENQRSDGKYNAAVIAVDKAGNYTTSSSTVSTTLDGNEEESGILNDVGIPSKDLVFYIDNIAPKDSGSKIIKTLEGNEDNRALLSKFGFLNGVLDEDYYKSGDTIASHLTGTEWNLKGYSIENGSVNESHSNSLKEFEITDVLDSAELTDNDISYTLVDMAGNETTGSITVSYSTINPSKIDVYDLESNEIYFVGQSAKLHVSEPAGSPEYVIAKDEFGSETYEKLSDLRYYTGTKYGLILSTQGKQIINLKSFSKAGVMTENNQEIVVDKMINYSGELRSSIAYSSSNTYTVTLDFTPVTEYVGLEYFKLRSTAGITEVNGSTPDTATEYQLNPSENPSATLRTFTYGKSYTITFTHSTTDSKKIKIRLKDKLGNEKDFDYMVDIKFNTNIIGSKAGSNKKMTSKVDIGSTGNINVRSRE